MKRQNEQLSEHFSLFELTQTNNATLQDRNRDLNDEQMAKLRVLAAFMEHVRLIVAKPVIVHSGYRCPELNGATPGSSQTSQHPLCEACDFNAQDLTPAEAFAIISGVANSLQFGQLILETKGETTLVHISTMGNRPPDKQQMIFKMTVK